MKNLALTVLNLAERRFLSKATTSYEPNLHDRASLLKRTDQRQGCKYGSLISHGIGRLLCYHQYRVSEPVTFYSFPIERVITLRIQAAGQANLNYTKQATVKQLCREDECQLFWQGSEIVEKHLLPDDHHQLELHYRPSVLESLSNSPKVKRLIKLSQHSKRGPLDFHMVQINDEIEAHVANLMDEIQQGTPSVKRFHYLADCLLLACLGEDTQALEWNEDALEAPENTGITEEEKQLTAAIDSLSGQALHKEFHECLRLHRERTDFLQGELALVESTSAQYDEICKESMAHLSSVYIKLAQFFATQYKTGHWGATAQKKLKRAIIATCKDAFELKKPSAEELDFYYQWAPAPNPAVHMGMKEFGTFLSNNMPDQLRDAMNLAQLPDTPEGRRIFTERLKEYPDFQSVNEASERDKHPAIVALYHHLMEALADRIAITEDGRLTRDDAIRLLDNAYDDDDLFALFMVEIKCFADDPKYLEQQDDQKMRWFVVSLRRETQRLEDEIKQLPKVWGYCNVELFRSLHEDDHAFKKKAAEDASIVEDTAKRLAAVYNQLYARPTAQRVMARADQVLAVSR